MKRPPGLWILLSAGVLWLCFQDTHGIRATELIFGKSPTSTTEASSSDAGGEEAVPSAESANKASNTTEATPSNGVAANSTTNSTKPTLTGNPQIDYVWDPNLPKELNGYNLSDYPFYERVPHEEIAFKCDGLHDGFYASVPHKCQVYHHCLFGTRYDFLCANYTAFDQKTFICQFVSEVDCENSKKYWHRNDALYQAASTTTEKPLRRDIYTPPPAVAVADPITPLPSGPGVARRQPGRRPFPRRRPQVEYYDDYYYDDEYYEERPRPRKRPRPKPRPVYDEEYDADAEYDDERYERPRGGGRRNGGRRPYRRPNNRRRNKDRRKEDEERRKDDDYDDDQEEVEDRFEDEDFVKAAGKRRKGDRRKNIDDYPDDEPVENRKRPNHSSNKRRPSHTNEDYDTGRKRKPGKNRRPIQDEYDDDDSLQADEGYDRPRKGGHKQSSEVGRPIIKPATGTIYDRPRVAPKINLPVPKNAADKFAYKPLGGAKTTPPPLKPKLEEEEELYDDYEEPPPKRPKNHRNKPQPSTEAIDTKPKPLRDHDETIKETKKHTTTAPRPRPHKEEESSERPSRLKYTPSKPKWGTTTTSTAKPISEEYYDDYEEEEVKDYKEIKHHKEEKQINTTTTSTTSTTTTTTTTTTPETPKSDSYVRIVKRPFLPSRGGNPYSARGLQPVGVKAEEKAPLENEEIQEENPQRNHQGEVPGESKSAFKPSPVIMKLAIRKPVQLPPTAEDSYSIEPLPQTKDEQASFRPTEEEEATFKPSPILVKIPIRKPAPVIQNAEAQEVFNSESSRQQNVKTGPRTTQKPKVIEPAERNPLDLNEYDVTLNDALNPTLPNLPVRSFPSAFGANDYVYNNFQRQRYVVGDSVVSQSNPDYVYQTKIRPVQRYEAPAQPSIRNTHYNIVTNGNYRNRESQPISQSQAFYSSY